MQVPPKRWRSTIATRMPAPVRRCARAGPDWPVPMTMASYSGILVLLGVRASAGSAGPQRRPVGYMMGSYAWPMRWAVCGEAMGNGGAPEMPIGFQFHALRLWHCPRRRLSRNLRHSTGSPLEDPRNTAQHGGPLQWCYVIA